MDIRHSSRPLASSRDDGFSLVELLVVMVVLGIVASIALPTLVAHADRARSAAVISDLQAAATAVESQLAVTGSYPADQAAFDALADARRSAEVSIVYVLDSPATFCLRGAHAGLGGGAVTASWDSDRGGLHPGAAC